MNAPLFVGYNSAAYRLLHYGMKGLRKSRALPAVGDFPRARRAAEAKSLLGLPEGGRVDLCLASDCDKRKGAAMKSHLCRYAAEGDYLSFGDGIYVAKPELAYLQSAESLSFPELVLLGLDMCGSFVSGDGGFERADPVSSVARMLSYVDAHSGVRGSRKARRALRYVTDGSASPRESQLVALLCIPQRWGGYGFKLPCLNKRLDLSLQHRRVLGKGFLLCDLLWPGESLGIEYDSNQHHSGARKINEDSQRRNVLRSMGINVIDVTSSQLRRAEAFHEVAIQVERGLGSKCLAKRDEGWMSRNQELRRLAFSEKPWDRCL